MKPPSIINDPCQVSIDVLRKHCLRFFADNPRLRAKHIWFIDDQEPCPCPSEGGVVDAVFFGGFVRRFMDSGNWTEQNYRLWCVSSAAKLVLVQLLGVPFDSIQVIPRTALFPTQTAILPAQAGSPMSFVFGGRLSATKNLELLIRTVNHLQHQQNFDVDLILFGEYDEEDHPDRGRRPPGVRFQESIENLIHGLRWKKAPRVIHGLGPEAWYGGDFTNPVYINLSTFICEDFDVSLAQVQRMGWPALISDWGGHLDVKSGPGTMKIPPSLLGHAHEGSLLTQARARNLAAWIARKWRAVREIASSQDCAPEVDSIRAPIPLTLCEIDRIRRTFVHKTGNEVHLINREGLDGFSLSVAGEKFFAAYRAAFSGKYVGRPTAILVNNFSESGSSGVRAIRHICERIALKRNSENAEVVFVPINECLHPQYTLLLAQARELVIPFWSEHLEPLMKWWTKSLNLEATIQIYTEDDLAITDRDRINALLRTQDLLVHYRVDALPSPILEP